MPPAGPFLSGQKGAKEPVKAGDADFPRLNNPPLETAKKGELRFPLLGTSPKSFYRLLSGGGGLLRNAPAAPACEAPMNVAILMASGPGVDSDTAIKLKNCVYSSQPWRSTFSRMREIMP